MTGVQTCALPICSASFSENVSAVSWVQVKNFPQYSYDADSIQRWPEIVRFWLREGNDDRTMRYYFIDCTARRMGSIVNEFSNDVTEIRPGSMPESLLMALCKRAAIGSGLALTHSLTQLNESASHSLWSKLAWQPRQTTIASCYLPPINFLRQMIS